MSRKSSNVSLGANPREPNVCEKPRELLLVSKQSYQMQRLASTRCWLGEEKGVEGSEMGTYDLTASLATMSDNDMDSCLGLFRPATLGFLCLLPPSCDDGEGVGTKLNGLGSSLGIGRWSKECECAKWGIGGGLGGGIIELEADPM